MKTSYEIYLYLHILGLALMTSAMFGAIVYGNAPEALGIKWRKALGMMHGIGLVIMLVAGFGLIAKLNLPFPFPMWIWIKILLWFVVAGLITVAFKKKLKPQALWAIMLAIIALAGFLAIMKPF